MADIQSIPILLSPNIAETGDFGRKIGLEPEFVGDDYVLFRGFGFELHYALTERPEVCSETSCYVRGGGILAVHEHLKTVEDIRLSEICNRPWGMTEFYLHDPHGNLIKFGMSTDELPDGLKDKFEFQS